MSIFEVSEIVAATGGEPRISAALLGHRLGMSQKHGMTQLVERNVQSLLRFGQFSHTVCENPSAKGGRPTRDYLLNEGQAIFIAAKSGTALANEVLIGLVHVFMEFRHGPALPPAISREEHAELEMKRAYAASLPEAHKAKAARKADALRQVEKLIDDGHGVREAIDAVAEAMGLGGRTLWDARRKAWMVAPSDYEANFAPRWKWNGPKGMVSECHPEAMLRFLQLSLTGAPITECYRRTIDEAFANGWAPVPPERTMRRVVERLNPNRKEAVRLIRRNGEV